MRIVFNSVQAYYIPESSFFPSPSFSLSSTILPPSSGEFVITTREPRNRNFAGYDVYIHIYIYVRQCSKESRRKGTLYPLRWNGERWVESNLQTSCTHPSQECPGRRLGEETVWRFPLTAWRVKYRALNFFLFLLDYLFVRMSREWRRMRCILI